MTRAAWNTSTYRQAVLGLLARADGLVEAPPRLHDHAVGDKDALGSPRFSGEFWRILISGPYAHHEAIEWRSCPAPHGPPNPPCERCNDRYGYEVAMDVYDHPLAAALENLRGAPATSRAWPKPYSIGLALLATGGSLERACAELGIEILSDDHRKTVEAEFLWALRKLAGRYATGPVPRAQPKSAAQLDAEAA